VGQISRVVLELDCLRPKRYRSFLFLLYALRLEKAERLRKWLLCVRYIGNCKGVTDGVLDNL
jgi:hypothetical protein